MGYPVHAWQVRAGFIPVHGNEVCDLRGSGTEADPYLIGTVAELKEIGNDGDCEAAIEGTHYRLYQDITLYGPMWQPFDIGTFDDFIQFGEAENKSVLDGDGYSITGVNVSSSESLGLFGMVTNFKVEDLSVGIQSLTCEVAINPTDPETEGCIAGGLAAEMVFSEINSVSIFMGYDNFQYGYTPEWFGMVAGAAFQVTIDGLSLRGTPDRAAAGYYLTGGIFGFGIDVSATRVAISDLNLQGDGDVGGLVGVLLLTKDLSFSEIQIFEGEISGPDYDRTGALFGAVNFADFQLPGPGNPATISDLNLNLTNIAVNAETYFEDDTDGSTQIGRAHV
jgi:hypothetical protein